MANIFTQNPMRIDSVMASDYLTTISASAGLERPIKVVSIRVENPTPTAGTWTITDGSTAANTLYELNLPATVGTNDDTTLRLWRNFKAPAPPAGWVMWIERR